MRIFRPSASRGEIYQTYKDKHYLPLKGRLLVPSRPDPEPVEGPVPCRLPGRSLSLSKGRPVPPFLIPGLTRNLSKRSATKSPFYAFKRGRCHFLNRGLPHFRPSEPDFVPDHFGRARPLVISTERPRAEKSSSTPRGTF